MDAVQSDDREDLVHRYLEQLPFEPYPVQEEALLAWFGSEQGVLVCARQGWEKRSSPRRRCSKLCTRAPPRISQHR